MTKQQMRIGIIILTIITAVIHFSLVDPQFILNGLGYLALLAALYLPIAFLSQYRHTIRWVMIGYTALTVILYFVFNGSSAFGNILGLIDKVVEVLLIILLYLER